MACFMRIAQRRLVFTTAQPKANDEFTRDATPACVQNHTVEDQQRIAARWQHGIALSLSTVIGPR